MKNHARLLVLAAAGAAGMLMGLLIPGAPKAWPATSLSAVEQMDWDNAKLFAGPKEHRPERWLPVIIIMAPDRTEHAVSGPLMWSQQECYRILHTDALNFYMMNFQGVPLVGLSCLPVPLYLEIDPRGV